MREPWDNDEEIDYTVSVDHWPAGGGPRGVWPEHDRVGLFCSACGRVQSQPPTTGLAELVIAAATHHHEKHDGPPGLTAARLGAGR